MRFFLVAILCSPAAFGARLGLYPLSLPDGQEQLAGTLAAQLHDGAAVLPGVQAFDLVAHSECAVDDAKCLATAARRAKLDAMISAEVTAAADGYAFHLREIGADGTLIHEQQGRVRGGPLDLSGALEHGVCALVDTAICEGEVRVLGASAAITVDGVERGMTPVILKLPVGRHVIKAGPGERRVRISYARTVTLYAATRAGAIALLDTPPAAPVEAVSVAPLAQPRAQASSVLFGSGAGLLAAAVGVGLYAHSNPSSDPARYGTLALGAMGVGAIVGAGLLLALTPDGGRF
jgi:hypothetical protein